MNSTSKHLGIYSAPLSFKWHLFLSAPIPATISSAASSISSRSWPWRSRKRRGFTGTFADFHFVSYRRKTKQLSFVLSEQMSLSGGPISQEAIWIFRRYSRRWRATLWLQLPQVGCLWHFLKLCMYQLFLWFPFLPSLTEFAEVFFETCKWSMLMDDNWFL